MLIIEKCVNSTAVEATYSKNDAHLWVPAWPGGKSRLDNLSFDAAIEAFFRMTARVRSVPYRLRTIGNAVTLAAINTIDAARFKKHSIFAVGFYPTAGAPASSKPVTQCVGAVAPHSAGTLVGACDRPEVQTQSVVNAVATALLHTVSSHGIQTRYSTNGRSGGAWLVTSATDGIMSNSEIGITYSEQAQTVRLQVSNKFLSNECFGNTPCAFTGKMDHASTHESVELAIAKLREVTREATEEEFALLILI